MNVYIVIAYEGSHDPGYVESVFLVESDAKIHIENVKKEKKLTSFSIEEHEVK